MTFLFLLLAEPIELIFDDQGLMVLTRISGLIAGCEPLSIEGFFTFRD
jgi:small neutral amino acid transporter SnatA (MarC family)